MHVPQFLHRTILPRATTGTVSSVRQVRLGHMIRTEAGCFGLLPGCGLGLPTRTEIGRMLPSD